MKTKNKLSGALRLAAQSLKLFTCLALCTLAAQAADIYVRDGSGSHSGGNNWDTAFEEIQEAVDVASRGDTIWVADGDYQRISCYNGVSGSLVITIKKAIPGTDENHGPASGWDDAYGNGQAVIHAEITSEGSWAVGFGTSNWVLDGQKRNESDWFDGSAYGFKIVGDGTGNADGYGPNHLKRYVERLIWENHTTEDNIQIKHTYVEGPNTTLPSPQVGWNGLYMEEESPSNPFSGYLVHRCFFRYGNVPILVNHADGMVVEYCAFADNQSDLNENHGEGISAFADDTNFEIRYNKFMNIVGTAAVAICEGSDGFKIHGNLFVGCSVGDGVVGFSGNSDHPGGADNTRLYNNTIVGCSGQAGFVFGGYLGSYGSGNIAKNNLWFDNASVSITGVGTHDYNAADGSLAVQAEDHDVVLSSDPFVDSSNGDFHLAGPIGEGAYLGFPYGIDMDGYVRGLGWAIDIGAYEYQPGGSSPQIVAGPIINPDNNHVYYVLDTVDAGNAEAQALFIGGHLTTINDSTEENWILTAFGSYDAALWIGLSDKLTEGTFHWENGTTVGYENWDSGEPNNGNGYFPEENAVFLHVSHAKWWDSQTGQEYRAVVEVDPTVNIKTVVAGLSEANDTYDEDGPMTGEPAHTYHLMPANYWPVSEAQAIILGGHLVSMRNEYENAWVVDTFCPPYSAIWIGLNDIGTEDDFIWESGDIFSFRKWMSGEPNNGASYYLLGEDYVIARGNLLSNPYEWMDSPQDQAYKSVVEIRP